MEERKTVIAAAGMDVDWRRKKVLGVKQTKPHRIEFTIGMSVKRILTS